MTTQARELAKLVNNSGDVNLGDDITLGSDGALLNFGADSDVVITHVADTGLLLNSSRQLQFGDSGTHIRQSADGVLQLTSDTEVEINATTIDINGNVDISGNLVLGGNITIGDADSDDISFGGELTSHIVPNADDTYDLGSSTKQWRNVYVDGTLEADAITVDGTSLSVITTENVQDIVGAMVTSNTETNITVTYEDSDGTLDFVVPSTLSGVTELGTLTTLTVDDITIDGSTISDAGAMTIDVGGNLTLDADGDHTVLAYGASGEVGRFSNESQNLVLYSLISDKDIKFNGNDGGSTITALTLDMSAAGEATFNDDINLADSKRLRMGAGGDFEIFHDGSHNYIKGASGDQDIIFQGVDGSSAITALTLDMSDAGTASFNHDVKLGDSSELILGDSSDIRMFHDSTNNFIICGNGAFSMKANGINIMDSQSHNMATFAQDGAVTLMYDNATKLATESGGVNVTGYMDADNFKINGAQGSDGQLMTSTGSGVAWEDAPASGPSKGLAIAFSMIF